MEVSVNLILRVSQATVPGCNFKSVGKTDVLSQYNLILSLKELPMRMFKRECSWEGNESYSYSTVQIYIFKF